MLTALYPDAWLVYPSIPRKRPVLTISRTACGVQYRRDPMDGATKIRDDGSADCGLLSVHVLGLLLGGAQARASTRRFWRSAVNPLQAG